MTGEDATTFDTNLAISRVHAKASNNLEQGPRRLNGRPGMGSWRVDHNDSAWGLHLIGPDIEPAYLVRANEQLPTVTVTISTAPYRPCPLVLDDGRAEIDLFGRGRVQMARQGLTSEIVMASRPTADEIIHPLLASTAVIMNHWLGRTSLHAGAMVVGHGAWALLGQRTEGKSTALAQLARLGFPVLTDDVLVVSEGRAYSGPRCLDLRQEAAARLGLGRDLGQLGLRERWRVPLGEVEPHYALRGIVFLEWSSSIEISPVAPSAALPRIFEHLALRKEPDPEAILALAGLPAWQWSRPRSWASIESSVEALVQVLEA